MITRLRAFSGMALVLIVVGALAAPFVTAHGPDPILGGGLYAQNRPRLPLGWRWHPARRDEERDQRRRGRLERITQIEGADLRLRRRRGQLSSTTGPTCRAA